MRITLLSNGHGEDTVGALLAEQLWALEPALTLRALPTVGLGRAYERAHVPLLEPRCELPSGGLLLHSLDAFWHDLRAGFLTLTRRQLGALSRLETDALIVVGDVYALLLSKLVKTQYRFYVQTLVSSYHTADYQAGSVIDSEIGSEADGTAKRTPNRPNRYFMEHFSPLERQLMRRNTHTYVRDAPTASLLARSGLAVSALGNPVLDTLEPGAPLPLPLTTPVVALLPGTRRYKTAALNTMLGALAVMPEATGLVAWTEPAPPDSSWQVVTEGLWRRGERVWLLNGRFSDVLNAADLVLSTAGTASEQAASLGKPVVAFAVPPLYTGAFLANQQRLLGAALTRCRAEPRALALELQTLWRDRARYQAAAEAGRTRMGGRGGAAAIATDILARSRVVQSVKSKLYHS